MKMIEEKRYPFPISDQRNSYLWGVSEETLDNKDEITSQLKIVSNELSLDVRDYVDYAFEVHGVTSALVLGASDLVGSSYTELGRCLHVHGTTCREVQLNLLHPILKRVFSPELIITTKEPLNSVKDFIRHLLLRGPIQSSEQIIQVSLPIQIN